MRPVWLNAVKYSVVGIGSLLAFFALVLGAAGVHAAISDHRQTTVEQHAEVIADRQLGMAIMPIIQVLYSEANRYLANEADIPTAHYQIMNATLKQQMHDIKLVYTDDKYDKVFAMLDKWIDTGFNKKNWLQVKNDSWMFMKKAAERHDVFWKDTVTVPHDLHYKIAQ